VRRDSNTEADAITNQDFSLFDENNRIHFSYPEIKWKALDKVMEASKLIFEQVCGQRQKDKLRRKGAATAEGIGGTDQKVRKAGSFGGLKRTRPW
jgi:hypothetical protein